MEEKSRERHRRKNLGAAEDGGMEFEVFEHEPVYTYRKMTEFLNGFLQIPRRVPEIYQQGCREPHLLI